MQKSLPQGSNEVSSDKCSVTKIVIIVLHPLSWHARILAVVWFVSTFGPPAPDEHAIGLSGLFIWLPVILGYWTGLTRAMPLVFHLHRSA